VRRGEESFLKWRSVERRRVMPEMEKCGEEKSHA
jgi:hypothetical protein